MYDTCKCAEKVLSDCLNDDAHYIFIDPLLHSALDGPSHAYFAHHKFGFDRAEASPIPCSIPVSNFTDLVTEVTYLRKRGERK